MTSLITQAALTGGTIPTGLAAIEAYDTGVIGDVSYGLTLLNLTVQNTIAAVRGHILGSFADGHPVTIEISPYRVYLPLPEQIAGYIDVGGIHVNSKRAKATVSMNGVATTVYVPVWYAVR